MLTTNFNPNRYKSQLTEILTKVEEIPDEKWSYKRFHKLLRKSPKDGKGMFSRNQLVEGYKYLVAEGDLQYEQKVLDRIKLRPVRTISGVTPVTVLTKPFPCPGKCIFCPNDVRMPKSYLKDEPGAQRAERNSFDPYLQTYNRLLALESIGHNTGKVELIVLGGTWSFYPESYQIWFIKRCFDAMNDFGIRDRRDEVKTKNDFEEADKSPARKIDGSRKSYNQIINEVVHNKGKKLISENEQSDWDVLLKAQEQNETAKSRCVGLVIETRPDWINEGEIIKFRKLGATKIQIGIQSLNDKVMELNKRGHGRKETENAIRLLRMGGFKIHAHWMPNLYGSSVKEDIEDYKRLWENEIQPDELKVYPTSIIANTGLYDKFRSGEFKPYSHEELLKVMTEIMPLTPRFCRLTRVVRDIPSTDIVAGNKFTNFRQIAEDEIKRQKKQCQCIRCREIKNAKFSRDDLALEKIEYDTPIGKEIFISYKTKRDDKIVGFLRLSLPKRTIIKNHFIDELQDAAVIREVHIYGQVVDIGGKENEKAQHLGLGTSLIQEAEKTASQKNYPKIAVISAIGTRNYYRKLGFEREDLYMNKSLKKKVGIVRNSRKFKML